MFTRCSTPPVRFAATGYCNRLGIAPGHSKRQNLPPFTLITGAVAHCQAILTVESNQVQFTLKITVQHNAFDWKGRFETGPETEAGKSPQEIQFNSIQLVPSHGNRSV